MGEREFLLRLLTHCICFLDRPVFISKNIRKQQEPVNGLLKTESLRGCEQAYRTKNNAYMFVWTSRDRSSLI